MVLPPEARQRLVTHIELGHPAQLVREYVRDHGADLVVLGTRGRGALLEAIVGSIGEKYPGSTALRCACRARAGWTHAARKLTFHGEGNAISHQGQRAVSSVQSIGSRPQNCLASQGMFAIATANDIGHHHSVAVPRQSLRGLSCRLHARNVAVWLLGIRLRFSALCSSQASMRRPWTAKSCVSSRPGAVFGLELTLRMDGLRVAVRDARVAYGYSRGAVCAPLHVRRGSDAAFLFVSARVHGAMLGIVLGNLI